MTRTLLLPWPVYKEVRALVLPWLACALVMIVPTMVPAPLHLRAAQLIALFIGAPVLGALSIGHEYMDRTLDALLVLPVRRQRLLLVKLGVMGMMLLTLGVVAYAGVFNDLNQGERLAASAVPVLCGVFLAPWLTMVCRSPLAGTVLTMATPLVLMILGWEIGFRLQAGPMFATRFSCLATSGLCAIGGVATWRVFMRLEAIQGRLEDMQLPYWPPRRATALRQGTSRRHHESNGPGSAAASFKRRHPVWQLVTKELRLQQLAVVIAGLHLFGWLAVMLLPAPVYRDAYAGLSALYAALLGVLIGAIASAEERQLGTIESQVLQPVAMWQQWAVKMWVVLGLAILLGIGLPMVLASVGPAADAKPMLGRPPAMTILLLTAGSLYVSSLCASGASALVMALPAAICAAWFQLVALGPVALVARAAWSRVFDAAAASGSLLRGLPQSRVAPVVDLLLIAGLIALLSRFALANHRFAERSPRLVVRQVSLIAAVAAARVVILSGVAALSGVR
jgi:hypothetical protein